MSLQNLLITTFLGLIVFVLKKLCTEYWLQIKAWSGSKEAQYQLGDNLRRGLNGSAIDRKLAFQYLEKAAKKGHNQAQCSVGFMCLNGEGTEQNLSKAFYWFDKAASEHGNREALRELGVMYENGIYVTQCYSKAVDYYRKSARGGNQAARDALLRLGETW